MKIFLLATLILLLVSRIKNTPMMVSEKIHRKRIQELISKRKDIIGYPEIYNIAMIFAMIFCIFCVVIYTILGIRFGLTYFIVLSALQIITVFYSIGYFLQTNPYSMNIDDYKFHRIFFLLNAILDYIYYPLSIYLLLK